MQFSQIISLAAFATAALARPASNCKPSTSTNATPSLPSTGSTDLTSPATNSSLLYIAVGHGIQNYTCANSTATAVNTGALAVLYDVTALYPGTPNTGLSNSSWDALTSTVLWNQSIPLNLVDPTAGKAQVSAYNAVGLSETSYNAVVAEPFLSPATDLEMTSQGVSGKFLGHHYFDNLSAPTFNLSGATGTASALFFSGKKIGDVAAPSTADKGVLNTKAIDWLELADNARGLSAGVVNAYRVVTAGGAAQACSVSGPSGNQTFSVPYTAEYWFYA